MDKSIGQKTWAIPEGYIPPYSHNRKDDDLTSHGAICILNTGHKQAHIVITIYFTDRDPVGPYRFAVGPQRTKHIRLNDLQEPAPVPKGTAFSTVIESDVDVVVQHTRIDTRQAENALMTTIAYAAD